MPGVREWDVGEGVTASFMKEPSQVLTEWAAGTIKFDGQVGQADWSVLPIKQKFVVDLRTFSSEEWKELWDACSRVDPDRKIRNIGWLSREDRRAVERMVRRMGLPVGIEIVNGNEVWLRTRQLINWKRAGNTFTLGNKYDLLEVAKFESLDEMIKILQPKPRTKPWVSEPGSV